MKIVVYTAIVPSEFDKLCSAMYPNKDVKYICFTDEPDKISYWHNEFKNWEIRKIEREYEDPQRDQKKVKILCHKFVEADVSIYTDPNIMFYRDPAEEVVLKFIEENDLALHINPYYNNIYVEGEVVLSRDKPNLVEDQLIKYKKDGFPGSLEGQVSMFAGGFIIRRHTKLIEEFNTNWWNEIVKHSKRDQLGLNYTIWKMGIKCSSIPWLSICGPIVIPFYYYERMLSEKENLS